MIAQEVYTPRLFAASGAIFGANGGALGGFLCSTSGTLQIRNGPTAGDAVIIASFPVTAGVWHPIPLAFPSGAYAELGGGATGTFGIAL